jgi:hypothetical protein
MRDPSESPRRRSYLLALKVIGAASWTAAYWSAAEAADSGEPALLPPSALAFNLAWEAIYTAGGLSTWRRLDREDRTQTLINASGLAADLNWLRRLSVTDSELPSHRAACAAVLYQLGFLAVLAPGDAARISALWQNLALSWYCAFIQPIPPRSDKNASRFTFFRAIGTAVPTLTSGVLRGIRPRYLVPGAGCVLLDLSRLVRQASNAGSATVHRHPNA